VLTHANSIQVYEINYKRKESANVTEKEMKSENEKNSVLNRIYSSSYFLFFSLSSLSSSHHHVSCLMSSAVVAILFLSSDIF